MRLVLAAVAALLLTTVAFAQKIAINSIRIEPPNPDSFTPVTIVVLGTWPTGCAPAGPTAIVAGNLIRVTATLPFSVCPAIVSPYSFSVRVPALPAGTYRVEVEVAEFGHAYVQTASRTFDVATADPPFTITPNAVPAGAAAMVTIESTSPKTPLAQCISSSSACSKPAVTFDGIPATNVTTISPTRITAGVPQHAAGAVDVVVTNTSPLELGRGFTYYAGGEESVFDRVLVPVFFNAKGAFGSDWTTELFIRNDGAQAIPILNTSIAPSRTAAFSPASFSAPNGFFIRPPRQQSGTLWFNSRVRDLSKQSADLGAELPIVRESEFRRGRIVIGGVRLDPNFRTTLRLYSIDALAFFSGMLSDDGKEIAPFFVRPTQSFADAPSTATINLTGASGTYTLTIDARPFDARVWAFVSVTNNDTQHVTVLSPK